MGSINAFLLLFLSFLLVGVVAAEIPADFALPIITDKPLLVVPGQPLTVSVYNGGHQLWSGFAVSVAGGPLQYFYAVLGPESYAEVVVDVPLVYLINQDVLSVSLHYDDVVLDTRSLPVDFSWPAVGAVVDLVAAGGPQVVVLLDAGQFDEVLGGVQVEFSVLKDDKIVFFDYYGPFYLAPNELFVWRSSLPVRYLSDGEYFFRATFYEGDRFLEEQTGSFVFGDKKVGFGPVLLFFVSFLLLIFIYLVMDMFFHRRSFHRSLKNFRD